MNLARRGMIFTLCSVLLAGCTIYRSAGSSSDPDPDKGYFLVTIDSDFGGVLPVKPDSFWSGPIMLELGQNKTYLMQATTGGYSFGGITGGFKIGWGTFGKAHFDVVPGKIVYLGKHTFRLVGGNALSWVVSDSLDESLNSLYDAPKKEIQGLSIEKNISQTSKGTH